MEQARPQIKWHLRPIAVIIALLCAGALALPLLWLSPAFKKGQKIVLTVIVMFITIWLFKVSVDLYYILLKELQALQNILNS